MIFHSCQELINHLSSIGNPPVVATSGGFDPIHVGHLACIRGSVDIKQSMTDFMSLSSKSSVDPVLVVIVNGDGFLRRKKGKPFMKHEERMMIVDSIKGVDYVVGWDDGSQTVTGAIEAIKPKIFTKGGDRSSQAAVPEFEMCEKVGTSVIFGVGGKNKMQSSSDLIKNSLTT